MFRVDPLTIEALTYLGTEFKAIPGYMGYYVSQTGKVLSAKGLPKLLRPQKVNGKGYPWAFRLRDDSGTIRCRSSNRLAAEAWGAK